MSEATEGLTGIDALEAEMRDRLKARNEELEAANRKLLERGREINELKDQLQADSIMAAKEIDFFRRDRDTWERRFNDLLKAHVEVMKLLPPQPMVVHDNQLPHLISNLTEAQKDTLYGLLGKTQVEAHTAVKVTATEAGLKVEPATIYNCAHMTEHRGCVFSERNWNTEITPKRCPGCPGETAKGQPANVRSQGFQAHVENGTAKPECRYPACAKECAIYGNCQATGGPIPRSDLW